MKNNKILSKNKQKFLNKVISLIILIAISYSFIPTFSNAATYYQYVKAGVENFPDSYKQKLNQILDEHPNWEFEAYYTGINWNNMLNDQVNGYSRVYQNFDTTWQLANGNNDHGWVSASRDIVAYYMDPRNFLNEVNVFEFEKLSFDPSIHTLDAVKSSVKGTFLEGNINGESYADIIYDAAQYSGMSPFAIKTKIIQEIGDNSNNICIIGNYSGYEGYYNYFNYGAPDTSSTPKEDALKYAKDQNWNSPRTAIKEGAKLIASKWVNVGQNTQYFMKFDGVGTKILSANQSQTINRTSYHQYMTNIMDPYSQSSAIFNAYTYTNNNQEQLLDKKMKFVIPVYEGMPDKTIKPSSLGYTSSDLYYADITSLVSVRTGPSTSYSNIMSLYRDDRVKMLARRCANDGVRDWDKVKLWNGTEAFVASQYLEPFAVSINISVLGVNLDSKELSLQVGNGATVTNTSISAQITPENANNKNLTWTSSNNNVATVENGYIKAISAGEATINVTTQDGNKTSTCLVKVINVENTKLEKAIVTATSLNVRAETNTSSSVIKQVVKDEQVTILQKDVYNDGNNIWYKIQLENGRIGYVSSNYLKSLENSIIDENNSIIKVIPQSLGNDISNNLNSKNYEIKDNNGNIIGNTNLVGTGYKVKNKDTGKEYTIIKMGDVNGDGKVNSGDYVLIKNHIMGTKTLDNLAKKGADVNKDEKVASSDYVIIKNYIMEAKSITL